MHLRFIRFIIFFKSQLNNNLKFIDQEFVSLHDSLQNSAHSKFCFEMEEFSHAFHHFSKTGNILQINSCKNVFNLTTNQLISKLQPFLGYRGEQYSISSQSIMNLLEIVKSLKIHSSNLAEIIKLSKEAKLTEKECSILEIKARLLTLPDFIDVLSLIISLCPDNETKNSALEFYFKEKYTLSSVNLQMQNL